MTTDVLSLLEAGIPLTLLCDLASTADPGSAAINSAERPDDDSIWLQAARIRRQLTRVDTG
jgi:hypothetical protein